MHKTLCLFVFFSQKTNSNNSSSFQFVLLCQQEAGVCGLERLKNYWMDYSAVLQVLISPLGGENSSLQCFFQPSSGHNFIIAKSNGILDSFSSGVCNLPNIKPAETCLVTLTWQLQQIKAPLGLGKVSQSCQLGCKIQCSFFLFLHILQLCVLFCCPVCECCLSRCQLSGNTAFSFESQLTLVTVPALQPRACYHLPTADCEDGSRVQSLILL